MILTQRLKTLLLLWGDIILFYVSLYLALLFRYRETPDIKLWANHQIPFLIIHILWIAIFYIGGLYDIKNFASRKKIIESLLKTMSAAALLAVIIFYLTPSIPIAPKTNLLIDIVILTSLLVVWRRIFWSLARAGSKIKLLFFGTSPDIDDLFQKILVNPQLGYEPVGIIDPSENDLSKLIKEKDIQLVIASKQGLYDNEQTRKLYNVMPLGVSITSFENFYESITERIPVNLINEMWFLENLFEIKKRTFEIIKRGVDIFAALFLMIPLVLFFPFVWLLSKIESEDDIIVRQKRVGKNNRIFTLYKIRTMYKASDGKAVWASEEDPRITKVGKFLRKTRLDELPQAINILKGEMSFIGPRPERPEFVEALEKEIPHYAMRHIIKPGATGWAQIKFPYGASIQDATEKLQYDLYYIKNRSLVLDLAIAARTIVTILSRGGR